MLGVLIRQERLRNGFTQEALCHGICGISYLSKIENGAAVCSDEIYEKLLARLKISYISGEDKIRGFKQVYEGLLEGLRSEGIFFLLTNAGAVSPLCKSMRFSSCCIQASLMCALKDVLETGQVQSIRMELLLPWLDEEGRRLWGLIRSVEYYMAHDFSGAVHALEAEETDGEPWTRQAGGFYCFKAGRYKAAGQKLLTAYQGFAQGGYIRGMLRTAQLLSATGSNSMDRDMMLLWNRTARQINRFVKDDSVAFELMYNLGATWLMEGDVDQGLDLLTQCEETLIPENMVRDMAYLPLYHKLAFAWALKGQAEKGEKYCQMMENAGALGHWQEATGLIRYMTDHKDYICEPEYLALLEQCAKASGAEEGAGFSRFYMYYILQACKAQRQYKKAAEWMETQLFTGLPANSYNFPEK